MNKFISYGPDKLNLWPFYHLTFKCDLDLQPTWTNEIYKESGKWNFFYKESKYNKKKKKKFWRVGGEGVGIVG